MIIQLKGAKALLTLLAVLGVAGFRTVVASENLDPEVRAELQTWLEARYLQDYLRRMDRSAPTAADADSLLARSRVEIVSLKTRGGMTDPVVRAEVRVDGGEPPDGRSVRYWKLRYSVTGGWRLQKEIGAVSFYLTR